MLFDPLHIRGTEASITHDRSVLARNPAWPGPCPVQLETRRIDNGQLYRVCVVRRSAMSLTLTYYLIL